MSHVKTFWGLDYLMSPMLTFWWLEYNISHVLTFWWLEHQMPHWLTFWGLDFHMSHILNFRYSEVSFIIPPPLGGYSITCLTCLATPPNYLVCTKWFGVHHIIQIINWCAPINYLVGSWKLKVFNWFAPNKLLRETSDTLAIRRLRWEK